MSPSKPKVLTAPPRKREKAYFPPTAEFNARWAALLQAYGGIENFAHRAHVTPSTIYHWKKGDHLNARGILTVKALAREVMLPDPLEFGKIIDA